MLERVVSPTHPRKSGGRVGANLQPRGDGCRVVNFFRGDFLCRQEVAAQGQIVLGAEFDQTCREKDDPQDQIQDDLRCGQRDGGGVDDDQRRINPVEDAVKPPVNTVSPPRNTLSAKPKKKTTHWIMPGRNLRTTRKSAMAAGRVIHTPG